MTHECNVYCSGDEHCDLVYMSRPCSSGELAQAYGYNLGLRVQRAEPAPEAPPFGCIPNDRRQPILVGATQPGHAYLVWWS